MLISDRKLQPAYTFGRLLLITPMILICLSDHKNVAPHPHTQRKGKGEKGQNATFNWGTLRRLLLTSCKKKKKKNRKCKLSAKKVSLALRVFLAAKLCSQNPPPSAFSAMCNYACTTWRMLNNFRHSFLCVCFTNFFPCFFSGLLMDKYIQWW